MDEKKQGFFKKLIGKLDKKLQKESEKKCSCEENSDDKQCCN